MKKPAKSSHLHPLPVRIRLLATVAAQYAIGEREKAKRQISQALRTRAVPRRSFSELFIHLSLFLGYPAMLDGLEHLFTLTGSKRGRTSLNRTGSSSRGRAILRKIYGKQTHRLLTHLDELDPGLSRRITRQAYGEIMGRRGLSLQERELVNVIVLFVDGYVPQLFSHLRGALRVGVDPGILQSVLELTGKLTRRPTTSAMKMIKGLLKNGRGGSF
jgi:4-carboxymuconolactone decarboxylase